MAQAPEALRISHTKGLVCSISSAGSIESVSDDLCALLGLNRAALLATAALEWLHPDDRRAATRQIIRQRRSCEANSIEVRVKSSEAVWQWLAWNIAFDTEQNRYWAVAGDIGDRKRNEFLLEKSHERLGYVLDATGDAVWDCDLISGEVTHNRRWIEMLGFTDQQLVHPVSFFFGLIHPDDQPPMMKLIEDCLHTGRPYHAEFRIKHAEGHYLWISDHGRIVARTPDGKPARMVGALADVTESKRIVEMLKLQTDALANMSEGISLCDREGHFLYTNPNFEQMFGFLPGELLGKHPSILNSPNAGNPAEVAEQIFETLKHEESWSGEVLNRRHNGEDFWSAATISAFTHPTFGKVWLTVQKDISETRRLQDERDSAYSLLEKLTARIQEDTEHLRRELAREVHDDIGAALTGLRIKIAGMAKRSQSSDAVLPEDYQRLLTDIDAATERTRALCTHLRPPILDDLGLIETCRWYLRTWSKQSGIRVRTRIRGSIDQFEDAVATDIFRVLQELLTNVARHAEASQIEVVFSVKNGRLRLVVSDNGRGFQTGNIAGLGLLGIRERLRHHGGMLTIQANVPSGVKAIVNARVNG